MLNLIFWRINIVVLMLHQWLWLGLFFVPFDAWLLAGSCLLSIMVTLGVEVGHHRYFSHRSFKTSRFFQFLLAVWAAASFQRSVLWWASMHRMHHSYSDQPGDPHSPLREANGGLYHAFINWGASAQHANVRLEMIKDLMVYPELVWLSRLHYLVNISLAVGSYLLGSYEFIGHSGWQTFVYLYVLPLALTRTIIGLESTVSHGVPHVPGSYRSYSTPDKSVNHLLLGLISAGGGFHNNHHRFPYSAKLGLAKYEFDLAFAVLCAFEKLGLIKELRVPTLQALGRDK